MKVIASILILALAGCTTVRLDDGLVAYFDFEDNLPVEHAFRSRVGDGLKVSPRGRRVNQEAGVRGKAVALHDAKLEAESNPAAGADHLSVAVWFKTKNPTLNYKLVSAAWWKGGNHASGWVLGTHYPEAWADENKGSRRGDCPIDVVSHFKPGEWNHVAITYDRERFREYINGKRVFDCASSGLPIGRGASLVIGGWLGFTYDGLIDEVRIYNRALSGAEIEALQ